MPHSPRQQQHSSCDRELFLCPSLPNLGKRKIILIAVDDELQTVEFLTIKNRKFQSSYKISKFYENAAHSFGSYGIAYGMKIAARILRIVITRKIATTSTKNLKTSEKSRAVSDSV